MGQDLSRRFSDRINHLWIVRACGALVTLAAIIIADMKSFGSVLLLHQGQRLVERVVAAMAETQPRLGEPAGPPADPVA